MSSSEKKWNEWFNLKGILLGNAIIDPKVQRYANKDYAVEHELISPVEQFFMDLPAQLCRDYADESRPLLTKFLCSFADSFVIGNPIWPIFDIRNIKKNCSTWFTCEEDEDATELNLNEQWLYKKLNVNMTSDWIFGWQWSDCNWWVGWR